MVRSPRSFLGSSLMIFSVFRTTIQKLRLLESRFLLNQRKKRSSMTQRLVANIVQQLENLSACLSSGMTSSSWSKSCQEHCPRYLHESALCVDSERDFIFIMDPQVPAEDVSRLTSVQTVSYSDSGWAGCRSQEHQQVECVSSTSRTQASISR